MDVVKLPKKFRLVCYEVMDGKEGALDTRLWGRCGTYYLQKKD